MKLRIWARTAMIFWLWQFPSQIEGQSCPQASPTDLTSGPNRLLLRSGDRRDGTTAIRSADMAKSHLASLLHPLDSGSEAHAEKTGRPQGTVVKQPPTFVSLVQSHDVRGLLHVFAVAEGGEVWHFREPGVARQWVVEPLGGKASSVPSASLTATGLLQAWIVGPEHA